MPIKKDGTGQRWVEMELLVPGTPEQVWQAIATGAGNTAWFTKAEIGEHVGGALRFNFGPLGSSSGEVTTWQPPGRFAYVERDWSEGAPPVATEITITGRAGGKCVVRMVHSLFASADDWDDQLESFESGWPAFFDVLRLYLGDFAGQQAASFTIMAQAAGDQRSAWRDLAGRLGLVDGDVGADWRMAGGPQVLSGKVVRVQQDLRQRYSLIRLDVPTGGVALIGLHDRGTAINVSLSLYLYGAQAAELAAASEGSWRSWFAEAYPARTA